MPNDAPQYRADLDAIASERRQKINTAAQQEPAAKRIAARLGLRFERRDAPGGGYVRNVAYCIYRRSWNVAAYCPVSEKLTIGQRQFDATTLSEAIQLTAQYEGTREKADCPKTPPPAPRKAGKKPKPTHRPKKRSHEATGRKLETIAPQMDLMAEDIRRIVAWGQVAADAEERAEPNRASLARELVERIKEAAVGGCKIVHDPAPSSVDQIRRQRERWQDN